MSRSLDEWIGKTDDTPVPPRVRARVIERAGNCCEHCGGEFRPQNPPEIDHREALIAGGANRESNLQALHRDCHKGKTRVDVAQKAKEARKRAKHMGTYQKTSRPVPGSKGSGWRKPLHGPAYRVDEERKW